MPLNLTAGLGTAFAVRYLTMKHRGKGDMATVYRARDRKHDQSVALELFNPDFGAMLGVEWFLAESKATATLLHANLLTLFDNGDANGLRYCVMPR